MNAHHVLASTAAAGGPQSLPTSAALVDPQHLRLILFDFDGTLADSFQAVVEILDRLSGRFGYPRLTPERIARLRDCDSRMVLQNSNVPPWQRPWLIYCLKRELQADLHRLQPIQGIEDVLRELRSAGYRLGIVTSNQRSTVDRFLTLMGWRHYFTWIDASLRLFSKDRAISRVRRQAGLQREAVAYVGDETRDVEAARRSGVVSLSVAWGFNSERALRNSQPDMLFQHPQELLTWVRSTAAASEKSQTHA
ncbi:MULTISPECIES: HAD-IA family hydrolase [Limnothrix]|uniref:HAD-IA family hydrolase n=1 Tax=Limnothrix redekei LRLZ20PSL1 TaxID=3112953 RepID=A0ABW7CEH4_9CYAN|nr:HAD-IA family hydrolase [Limnothrix sp. PR1529]